MATTQQERSEDRAEKHWHEFIAYQERILRAVQMSEAEKKPQEWRPISWALPTGDTQPHRIVPKNNSRDELSIYNDGSFAVVLGPAPFDVTNAANFYGARAEAASPQQWALAVLDAGATLTLKTQGAVWAWNAGTGTTTLQIVEAYFLGAPARLREAVK